MSPVRPAGPAYWSSGGAIVGRSGPLGGCALELFQFYAREAVVSYDSGEADAAGCCLSLALELAAAIVSAADWTRAASGRPRDEASIDRLRHLTLRLSGVC